MSRVLSIFKAIVSAPVRLLWVIYTGIWWAFTEDQPQTASPAFGPRTAAAAQDAAFEVIDSRPRPSRMPVSALRGGFIATLIASALIAWGCHSAYAHAVVRGSTSLALWLWSTGIVTVVSLWAVRNVVRRQALETDMGGRANLRILVAAAGYMGRSTVNAAATAKNVTVRAGQRVAGAVRATSTTVRRVTVARRAARTS